METIKTNSSRVHKTTLEGGISIIHTESRSSETMKVAVRSQVTKNDVDAGSCYTTKGVYQLNCNLNTEVLDETEAQIVMSAIISDITTIVNKQ